MTCDRLQAHIAASPAPSGLILHIGGGRAAPFANGLPEGLQMTHVEADPDRAASLSQDYGQNASVTIRNAAVAAEAGPATLYRFSPAAFSSLCAPKTLGQVYPGLGRPEELPVDAIALSEILAEASAEGSAVKWLILDAPGSESALLAAFAAAQEAASFDHLIIRATHAPFYEGPAFDSAAIGGMGFEIVDAWRDADPDWLWYAARRKEAVGKVDPEEVASLQRDLRVAMRSRALAEDDLRDLRARYAAVSEERARQEALIGKLAARLEEASDWLHRLGPPDDGPEALREEERAPRQDEE